MLLCLLANSRMLAGCQTISCTKKTTVVICVGQTDCYSWVKLTFVLSVMFTAAWYLD